VKMAEPSVSRPQVNGTNGITEHDRLFNEPGPSSSEEETGTDEQLFDDNEGEEEESPKHDLKSEWILLAVGAAILIVCVISISILISLGHLGPLTHPVDNRSTSTDPNTAGISAHDKVASISNILQSPFVSSSAASPLTNGLNAKIFHPDDIVAHNKLDDDDKYDDAPNLAAFMGLKYRHDHHSDSEPK